MKIIKYLSAIFIVVISFQEIGYCKNPKIDYVELTDNSTHAGTRKSRSTLKCVAITDDSGSPQEISLNAVATISDSGDIDPTWTATSKSIAGNGSSATWTGLSNSTIKAELNMTSSQADIEISNPHEKTFAADTKKFQPWLDKTNAFLKSVNQTTAAIKFNGEITLTTKNVDFYDDGEKLGSYGSIGGSLQLQTSDPIKSPYIPWVVAGPVFIQLQLILEPISIKIGADLAVDESRLNPWGTSSTAELSANTGLTGTAELGLGVPASQAKGLVVTGSVSALFGCKVKFKGEDKKILSNGSLNVGKVEATGKVDFRITDELTWTVGSWGPVVLAQGFGEDFPEQTIYDFKEQ
jgi:hypothetical protein